MLAQVPTLSVGSHAVLQELFNTLKGSGSTSYIALASAIALTRTGLGTEHIMSARQLGYENYLPDDEIELAVRSLHKQFDRLDNVKYRQILEVLELYGQSHFSDKDWGAAFDMSLEKFKPVLGKKSLLLQPTELVQLVASIYRIEEGNNVHSPYAGGCCVVPYLPTGVNYTAQESQDEVWAIGKLRSAAYGLNETSHLSKCDPALGKDNHIYDLILSFPPFEFNNNSYINQFSTGNSADATLLEKYLPSIVSGSKMIMIVPYWFLSAVDNFELRKYLVENDLVESVVYIPDSIYAGVSYPVALLCLNKAKNTKDKILFFNAEGVAQKAIAQRSILDAASILDVLQGRTRTDDAKFISKGMVQKRGYHLHPRWHLLDVTHGLKETDDIIRLSSIATILDGKYRKDAATIVDRVLIKDLCEDGIDFDLAQPISKKTASNDHAAYIIDEPCLLVALAWFSLKPTWFNYINRDPICIGSEICALNIDTSKIDVAYLISELHSPFVMHQFKMLKGGMNSIWDSDLLKIEVRLPKER
jgi:type I restriction enzyme M protein